MAPLFVARGRERFKSLARVASRLLLVATRARQHRGVVTSGSVPGSCVVHLHDEVITVQQTSNHPLQWSLIGSADPAVERRHAAILWRVCVESDPIERRHVIELVRYPARWSSKRRVPVRLLRSGALHPFRVLCQRSGGQLAAASVSNSRLLDRKAARH
jgi:hypothetical protein